MNSHAVGPVVLMGASQYAVPPVRFLLDVLEEVRRPEDAEQSRRPRGEDLSQSSKQCKNLNQILWIYLSVWKRGGKGDWENIQSVLFSVDQSYAFLLV